MQPAIILASASPRRRQLLEQIHADFSVIVPDIDETVLPGEKASGHVKRLAMTKAAAVDSHDADLVIAADTVLWFKGKILGKPSSEEDACAMLASLSGKRHTVYTGLAIMGRGAVSCTATKTAVYFRKLDREQIISYVRREVPFDCAGAYRIQDLGALLVRKIRGSFTNVVGFPLETLYREALQMGYDLLRG